VNALNPERIVVGGSVAEHEPAHVLEPMRRAIAERAFKVPAAAVSVEMSPPQPSIARSLRLPPGLPVIMVTVRFDDPATGEPAGLTVVMLKPELFRVAIDTSEAPAARSLAAGGASIVAAIS